MYHVSFGTAKDGAEINPPAGYLKVLADLKLDIRAASAGKRHLGAFRDKKTGNAGALLTVAIHKKVSDKEVILSASCYRGRLNSDGYKVRLVKEGDRWVPKNVTEWWVS